MAEPNGEYPVIEHSQPKTPSKADNAEYWRQWQEGQKGRLGNFEGTDKNPVKGQAYDIYRRNGQEIHVTPAGDDFSYRYALPGETSEQANARAPEYYPGGEQLRDALAYLQTHPNEPWHGKPWRDVNGKPITAATATIPQLHMISDQVQSFNRPQLDLSVQNRILAENMIARDMDSVRKQLSGLSADDLTASVQALKKAGVDWTGMTASQLAAIPGVSTDTIHKLTRLQDTLSGLANKNIQLAGMPSQTQGGGANDLPSHLTNLMSEYGILKAAGAGAAGPLFVAAGAVKGVGALLQGLTDGSIDQNRMRDDIQPETNNVRKSVHNEVLNAQNNNFKFGDDVADAANEAAKAAQTDGVGYKDSAYDKSKYTYGTGEQAQEQTAQKNKDVAAATSTGQDVVKSGNVATGKEEAPGPGRPGPPGEKQVNPLDVAAETLKGVTAGTGRPGPPDEGKVVAKGTTDQGDKGSGAAKPTPAPLVKPTPEPPAQPEATPSRTPAVAQPKAKAAASPRVAPIAAPNAGPELQGTESSGPGVGPQLGNPTFAPKDYPTLHLKPWGIFSGASNDQLPSDAAMGAPLGAPDNKVVGGQPVAHLFQQEHVDGLAPGTPFYWADHPDPYVKV